ncbi:hypothetical protein V6N11_039751 [Hibiscus sabdariffa]|uniref:Uncharacterized protein n=1 Tax=Hibiscus sabdariffa TaxID=183260 RepID=A0ABR2NG39_9ROSI
MCQTEQRHSYFLFLHLFYLHPTQGIQIEDDVVQGCKGIITPASWVTLISKVAIERRKANEGPSILAVKTLKIGLTTKMPKEMGATIAQQQECQIAMQQLELAEDRVLPFWKYVGVRDKAVWKVLASISTNSLPTSPTFSNELRMPEEMPAIDLPKPTTQQQSDARSTAKSSSKDDAEKMKS